VQVISDHYNTEELLITQGTPPITVKDAEWEESTLKGEEKTLATIPAWIVSCKALWMLVSY
jgi:hypothetical protein